MHVLLDVVAPIFGLVALGYAAAWTGALDQSSARGLSIFVFQFALPVALFRSMVNAELPAGAPLGFLAAYYLGTALMFVPALVLAPGGLDRRTILGFGCAYSNTVILGIPLVASAFGPEGSVALLLLIAFHGATFFTLVTALIESARGARAGPAAFARDLGKALLTNVILLAILSGLALSALGIRLPGSLDRTAELLARAALPGALFSMGVSLHAYRIAGAVGPALLVVVAKLVLHPILVAFLATQVLAVPRLWAHVAILSAALPVGVNVFLFAARYRIAEAETATAILLSNMISVVTVAAVLAILEASDLPP